MSEETIQNRINARKETRKEIARFLSRQLIVATESSVITFPLYQLPGMVGKSVEIMEAGEVPTLERVFDLMLREKK